MLLLSAFAPACEDSPPAGEDSLAAGQGSLPAGQDSLAVWDLPFVTHFSPRKFVSLLLALSLSARVCSEPLSWHMHASLGELYSYSDNK